MKHVTPVVAAIACWDAGRWYLGRVWVTPEEAIALVALLGLLLLRGARQRQLHDVPLWPLAALLLIYASSYLFAPPILRAGIALIIVLTAAHQAVWGRWQPLSLCGIGLLALPVLPSLQFYLGYPLRLLGAALTALLLQAQGFSVSREGLSLAWRGEMLQFDAPCSGVSMLWAGLLLTLTVCWLQEVRGLRLALALLLAVGLSIIFNVLRAGSLFYLEAGLISDAPAWWHEGVGAAAFVLACMVTLACISKLQPRTAT